MILTANVPREPFGRRSDGSLAHQQAQDYSHLCAWAQVGQIGSTRLLGRLYALLLGAGGRWPS